VTDLKLYSDLAPWYRLFTPPEEYVLEARRYASLLTEAVPSARTLLELGCGAGHIAAHWKARFQCTLTDLSPQMLALSQALNPTCAHHLGDMRTLRLDERFDVVFVHDAVCYMTTEADLARAVETAFMHVRPGGAALFVPDVLRETFAEATDVHEVEEQDGRALRCLAWTWDPEPSDDTYVVEYAFLLREHGEVHAVHDRHVEGMFPRAVWQRVLRAAGFDVEDVPADPESEHGEAFLGHRRG
jgi:SAM-dependent methyltransferase